MIVLIQRPQEADSSGKEPKVFQYLSDKAKRIVSRTFRHVVPYVERETKVCSDQTLASLSRVSRL